MAGFLKGWITADLTIEIEEELSLKKDQQQLEVKAHQVERLGDVNTFIRGWRSARHR